MRYRLLVPAREQAVHAVQAAGTSKRAEKNMQYRLLVPTTEQAVHAVQVAGTS